MNGDTGRLVSLILEDIVISWFQFSLQSRRHNCQHVCKKAKESGYFRRKGLKSSKKIREGARLKDLVG